MAKVTALQEVYQENKKLQATIDQLQSRMNVISLDSYTELQEKSVAEIKESHKKIAELEKVVRRLRLDNLKLSKELEKKKEVKSGRKPLDSNIIDNVHKLKMNNMSIRDIQKNLKQEGILISVGAIHKTIHGSSNKSKSK